MRDGFDNLNLSEFNIYDTHCHLDDISYMDDIESVIDEAKRAGIKRFVIPGASAKDLDRAIELSEKYEEIYFASGIHPYDVDSFDIDFIRESASRKKCVAIGECGLDYYRLPTLDLDSSVADLKSPVAKPDFSTTELIEKRDRLVREYKDRQKRVFIEQIELAVELRLPLIIHIRDASFDSFEILKEYKDRLSSAIFHCFNADEMLLHLGNRFYYGIGGVATFKNARKLIEILSKVPKNRLIFETDSPYLTPHPHRGERNKPSYIPLIIQKVSDIYGMDFATLCHKVEENQKSLFGSSIA